MDKAIGANPLSRFVNYYFAEWGQSSAPTDPNAPPATRAGWPVVPQTTPPMPFTDWPYGGTTLIGDNHTASIDSPLMVAVEHTGVGPVSYTHLSRMRTPWGMSFSVFCRTGRLNSMRYDVLRLRRGPLANQDRKTEPV